MAHNYIIQWNCIGLRSNREDIELLISKYSPAAIFSQETLLTPHQTQTFKHYSAYYKSSIHGHGGVCILVKDKFIHSQVQFQADLQAVAVCITINNKTYTVASVYVPPSETLNELAFDRMINNFSSQYLILGDFNGHSHLWGANQENERGKIVEKLIDCHNLILLNDSVHTRFDTYQTSSLLDLSLCHPSIYMGDGGGRPSSVMSLGVTSVGGHSHGHPASPIGVGSSWDDIDPRSPEPLVVRGGWLWLIWVVRWTT